jgi:hypothetical protein
MAIAPVLKTGAPKGAWGFESLALRFILALILVLWGSCVALNESYYATHPAPLGRSQRAVERTLAQVLPVGTSLDSARAFLGGHGLRVWMVDPNQNQYGLDAASFSVPGGDVLFSSGPAIGIGIACQHDAQIYIAFDSAHRLVRRSVVMLNVCI